MSIKKCFSIPSCGSYNLQNSRKHRPAKKIPTALHPFFLSSAWHCITRNEILLQHNAPKHTPSCDPLGTLQLTGTTLSLNYRLEKVPKPSREARKGTAGRKQVRRMQDPRQHKHTTSAGRRWDSLLVHALQLASFRVPCQPKPSDGDRRPQAVLLCSFVRRGGVIDWRSPEHGLVLIFRVVLLENQISLKLPDLFDRGISFLIYSG